nr:hypothetical protein CFP56_24644 [Quercus suber]
MHQDIPRGRIIMRIVCVDVLAGSLFEYLMPDCCLANCLVTFGTCYLPDLTAITGTSFGSDVHHVNQQRYAGECRPVWSRVARVRQPLQCFHNPPPLTELRIIAPAKLKPEETITLENMFEEFDDSKMSEVKDKIKPDLPIVEKPGNWDTKTTTGACLGHTIRCSIAVCN